MPKHDTWVNRQMDSNGDPYYVAVCLCEWDSEPSGNPDKAHEEGVAHMAETAEPIPDHLTWLNMGIEWLDTDGAKRIVYTPICTCGWMGERQTDLENAQAMKVGHDDNPVSPNTEGE